MITCRCFLWNMLGNRSRSPQCRDTMTLSKNQSHCSINLFDRSVFGCQGSTSNNPWKLSIGFMCRDLNHWHILGDLAIPLCVKMGSTHIARSSSRFILDCILRGRWCMKAGLCYFWNLSGNLCNSHMSLWSRCWSTSPYHQYILFWERQLWN